MKSIAYHLFKDIMSTSTPSVKAGHHRGVVIKFVTVGVIIILVVIVIGKHYTIIVEYYIITH